MGDAIRTLVAALSHEEREAYAHAGTRPRCPKTRQGDGGRCIRPIGHPGDCTASYGSLAWDPGFGPGEDMGNYPFDMSLLGATQGEGT